MILRYENRDNFMVKIIHYQASFSRYSFNFAMFGDRIFGT
jgi:hypothetical protein